MLRASGINPAAKLEQARRVPFGGVGHDLSEEILKALGLLAYSESNSVEGWDNMRTWRIVVIKIELAFERQKKVVAGLEAALTSLTPRTIAGCFEMSISRP